MPQSLNPDVLRPLLSRLAESHAVYGRIYPREPIDRQAVHTVYGGAHLFKRDSARRLGDLALASLRDYAPDADSFARAVGFLDTDRPDAEFIGGLVAPSPPALLYLCD